MVVILEWYLMFIWTESCYRTYESPLGPVSFLYTDGEYKGLETDHPRRVETQGKAEQVEGWSSYRSPTRGMLGTFRIVEVITDNDYHRESKWDRSFRQWIFLTKFEPRSTGVDPVQILDLVTSSRLRGKVEFVEFSQMISSETYREPYLVNLNPEGKSVNCLLTTRKWVTVYSETHTSYVVSCFVTGTWVSVTVLCLLLVYLFISSKFYHD